MFQVFKTLMGYSTHLLLENSEPCKTGAVTFLYLAEPFRNASSDIGGLKSGPSALGLS
jgi:hypothetical protein